MGQNGKNIEDTVTEGSKKQPYYKIFWTGWMDDSSAPLKLEQNETRYIKFTFLKPVKAGYDRGILAHPDYLGLGDGSKEPKKTKTNPFIWDFFTHQARPYGKGPLPNGLRKEFKDGSLSIQIILDNSEVKVNPSKLMNFKMIKYTEWKDKPVEYLFHNL